MEIAKFSSQEETFSCKETNVYYLVLIIIVHVITVAVLQNTKYDLISRLNVRYFIVLVLPTFLRSSS